MYRPDHGDVEQKHSFAPGTILRCAAVFGMLLLLLFGKVRLYEQKEQCRRLRQSVEQQQTELQELWQELQNEVPLRTRAEELGMEEIDPQEVVVLHITETRGK